MTPQLIIFDFDGVIADSETIACDVLARFATELGCPMSLDESIERFMGKRIGDVTTMVEHLVGHSLPHFADELQCKTLAAFRTDLREVPGCTTFLRKHAEVPRCIASSSSRVRIEYCLNLLGLAKCFGDGIFSADAVKRGKPFPDIFLYAASKMSVQPKDALVIEDSPGGVRAAIAADMQVIGLLAASHIRPGHEARLVGAGAKLIAHKYDDIDLLLSGPNASL